MTRPTTTPPDIDKSSDGMIELLLAQQQQINDLIAAQSNLAAENKSLNDKVVSAATQAALNKPVSSTVGIAGGNAIMPRERIMEFLNSTRPATEFFVLRNPYYKFQLDAGKEAPWSVEQNRSTGKPIPGFWMCMQFWFGPGCEIRKQDGAQKYKIGHCNIAADRLMIITKEDIKKYNLGPLTEERPEGVYEISVLLARIYNDDDYRLGRVITGEQFKEVLRAEYETLWSTQQNQERLAERLANLRSGAEKTGILADEGLDRLVSGVGPEKPKSENTIVEPVVS